MPDPTTIPTLMNNWSIDCLPLYLGVCALLALGVRIVHCIIKAWSAKLEDSYKEIANLHFIKRFEYLFGGFGKESADHWLGAIIGFAEISFYPVLLFTDNFSAIGGWLAIKTAGSWKMWSDEPRSFNRFLLSNLFNLAIAYFITIRWIQ